MKLASWPIVARRSLEEPFLGPLPVDRIGNLFGYEVEDVPVLLGEAHALRVALDHDHADRLALARERRADPVDGGWPDQDDFSVADETVEDLGGGQHRTAGPQHVLRQSTAQLLGRGRSLLFVDEVREFEGLPLVVDQGDVEVRGRHEPADDLVNLTVQFREILRAVRGFGDPVDRGLDASVLRRFVTSIAEPMTRIGWPAESWST